MKVSCHHYKELIFTSGKEWESNYAAVELQSAQKVQKKKKWNNMIRQSKMHRYKCKSLLWKLDFWNCIQLVLWYDGLLSII